MTNNGSSFFEFIISLKLIRLDLCRKAAQVICARTNFLLLFIKKFR